MAAEEELGVFLRQIGDGREVCLQPSELAGVCGRVLTLQKTLATDTLETRDILLQSKPSVRRRARRGRQGDSHGCLARFAAIGRDPPYAFVYGDMSAMPVIGSVEEVLSKLGWSSFETTARQWRAGIKVGATCLHATRRIAVES
jgi:hypothetical protein